ncbi:MAG: sugar phosphate isomerase/epimerase [Chloroflexi bacterium]|nr:sugar phosphate isomerase/epimerase [Chloroflexota bacterium]
MPKFGAHAFLWIDEWTTEKGNKAIRAAATTGFDIIEIALLRPDQFDAANHKRELQAAGITATASVALPKDAHMPEQPEKARRFLIAALDKLEAVGGTYLCGPLAFGVGKLTGKPPTQSERQVVIDTLGEVAEEARKRGLSLGLEVLNRYETYVCNTLADARDIIKTIGASNLSLHADTYHMNIEEEGFYKPLLEVADVLGYVHISESHRGLAGTGTINWDQVFQGLKDARYTGPLVLESFATPNEDLAAATCIWRPLNASSEEIAHGGLQFLRNNSERFNL